MIIPDSDSQLLTARDEVPVHQVMMPRVLGVPESFVIVFGFEQKNSSSRSGQPHDKTGERVANAKLNKRLCTI